MNKERRKAINEAIDLLEGIQNDFDRAKALIADVAAEEQDGFDNLSEGLQAAERGQRMEEVAGWLQEVADELEALDFDDLVGRLDDCKE